VDVDAARLRAALLAAGYTVEGVSDLLGPLAHAALGRAEPVPALRVTRGGSPLETLVRLFLLGTAEPADRALAALAGQHALLALEGGSARAAYDVRPYGESWYVVSDVTPARDADHVVGVGGASVTLVQAVPPGRVGSALDLGTGCGVQALHLAEQADRVTASDVNPRALRLARLTAALSEVDVDFVEGDLLAPVSARQFDRVVANPPFVVGPALRFTYRDSGLPGDEMSARLVRGVSTVLADGGTAVLLASWLHVRGADWRERVAGWVTGTGCEALVLQREAQDPAQHAELWLRDAGEVPGTASYDAAYDAWLSSLEDASIDAVGFGIVLLRHGGVRVRVEELYQAVEQPIGRWLGDWLDVPRLTPASVLTVADGVDLETHGWHGERRVLAQTGGLRRRAGVDEVGVALLRALDGTRPLAAVLAVAQAAFGVDPDAALPVLQELAEEGFVRVLA
jgi:methylase of polypeptide subunit release factors